MTTELGLYQIMPELSREEYESLREDIKERGVQVPIEIDEKGNVLDGLHRLKICAELGIKDYPVIIRTNLTEEEKRAHARKLNLLRRHLNQEQKRKLVADQLKETPEISDRQIGQDLGVSPTTVGSTRTELEEKGQLSKMDSSLGADGKVRPRKRKQAAIIARTDNEKKKALQSIDSANEKVETSREDGQTSLFTVKELKGKSLTKAAEDGDELTDQQEQMVDKFKRLQELEEQGVYIGSIWSFEERANYAGDGLFHGNSAPQVIENAILFYTQEGDTVLDPMAGSGTILNVCEVLDRKCLAFDLNPGEDRITQADARELPLTDSIVDFIFWHPPYWNMVKYSDKEEDLSGMTWEGFLEACREVLSELKRVLKDGGNLVILSGDKVEDGKFYPISRKVGNLAEEIGLTDCGIVIKPAYNTQSQIVKGKTIFAELAFTNNIKIEHDTINIFRK